MLDAERLFWRDRYREQVGWSHDTRHAILKRLNIPTNARLLEVGCGFGALVGALKNEGFCNLIGLDIDLFSLLHTECKFTRVCGDGLFLPFPTDCFDICVCHYFLLWVANPFITLCEMARVTKSAGWVITLAEPDYGGRVDYPPEMEPFGRAQTSALADQGADIQLGRRLGELFNQVGLVEITCGVLPARWAASEYADSDESELRVLERDLAGCIQPDELNSLRKYDKRARQTDSRVLYVPTFYAFGKVP